MLLHYDDPEGRVPWLNWPTWLAANGAADLKPAGALRFSVYDQAIQAAVGEQGVALGRLPMVQSLLDSGQLAAPLPKRFDAPRGYYVLVAPHATARADVAAFVAFLREEAAKAEAAGAPLRTSRRRKQIAHGRRIVAAMHAHTSLAPSPWIVRFAPLVREGARVLDLACGYGRHARYFAGRGAHVLAVDRDTDALATLDGVSGVTTLAADLEGAPWPFGGAKFDAIVVVNYLHRPLLHPLLDALAPDGVLLYETFAQGNEAYGRPSNPAFLLASGELLDVARGRLAVIAFEQGHVQDAEREAVVQRLAAVGPGRGWPIPLPA